MSVMLLDFSIACLVCLREDEEYCSIFGYDDQTPQIQLIEKIECCSTINLPKEQLNKYPNKICRSCHNDLAATWRFRHNCEEANKVFSSIQQDQQNDIDHIAKLELQQHRLELPKGLKIQRVSDPTPTKPVILKLEVIENAPDALNSGNITPDYETEDEEDIVEEETSASVPREPSCNVTKTETASNTYIEIKQCNESENVKEQKPEEIEANNTTGQTPENIVYAVYQPEYDDLKEEHSTSEADEVEAGEDALESERVQQQKIETDQAAITKRRVTKKNTKRQFQIRIDDKSKKTGPGRKRESNRRTGRNGRGGGTSGTTRTIHPIKLTSHSSDTHNNNNASQQQPSQRLQTRKRKSNSPDNRPPKICEICGNSYKYQHALNAHMRRHTNERPYPCEFCDKAFVSGVELRRHMRVHTGQKPYACKYCERRFSDFGSRIKHERTHTGERPYSCPTCNKSFAYAHVLSVHVRTHTGEKKFQCERCGKGFTKKAYLLTHREQHERAGEVLASMHLISEEEDGDVDENITVDLHMKEEFDSCDDEGSKDVLEECIITTEYIIDRVPPHSDSEEVHEIVELADGFIEEEHLDETKYIIS